MKLQPALIFGEHMVLQRDLPIPVWGRSVRGDTITVTLNSVTRTALSEKGEWRIDFPPMAAAAHTEMIITSALTGESIAFHDIAIGEVWLAGGQSNMEFLLKFDEKLEEMLAAEDDPQLRFFRYPTAAFTVYLEREASPDDGFWRSFVSEDDRKMFSAVSAYMGRRLRETLNVPVAFIGVNWGGTPAAAWTAREDLEANPALAPVLEWYDKSCAELDFMKYYAASEMPDVEPDPEIKKRHENFMMGVGLEELFKGSVPPPPPSDYTPYMAGPRGAIRPAGLYDCMLTKVAPYQVRGAIWYQGEDDDFRGWYSFYDESMKSLITSWRKLWGRDLPFLQVELAPFKGRGITGAKEYYTMRVKQGEAAAALEGVHDVCILDSGDPFNIHVRKKKPVGERLALLARKYVYGEAAILADSPRLCDAARNGGSVVLRFSDTGDGLCVDGDLEAVLQVTADSVPVKARYEVKGDSLYLYDEAFSTAETVSVAFCMLNDCVDPLKNSAGLPAFQFKVEI